MTDGRTENETGITRVFHIPFTGGSVPAVIAPRGGDPRPVLETLGLTTGRPGIAIMGGAASMDESSINAARVTIEDGLARFAQAHDAAIVDGGTTAGVMAMMGAARRRYGYTFPLIGVAPQALVDYPGHDIPDEQSTLDAHHSHFILTDGDEWGAESDMLAGVTRALAGKRPALGIIINGGAIVKREAYMRATGRLRFPLLVLEGSGRFADELAAAVRAGGSDDPQLGAMLASDTPITLLPLHAEDASVSVPPSFPTIRTQSFAQAIPLPATTGGLYGWLGNYFGV